MPERVPPEGFVDLNAVLRGAHFRIGYATPHNFTGAVLPGYGAPGAWLLGEVAERLLAVARQAHENGFALRVYDAYRPRRATRAMTAWCKDTGNTWILDEGFVSSRSTHNRGNTIDLSLVQEDTGEELDFGTTWDTFTPASHTANATGAALVHRMQLRTWMMAAGFDDYRKEWWHFCAIDVQSPPRDVPYGSEEPEEGAFLAPPHWEP